MKRSSLQRYVNLSKYMIFDAIAIAVTYLIAVFMFLVLEIPVDQEAVVYAIPLVIIFKLVVFYFSGLYKMLVNHVGFEDVIRIAIVVIISNVAIVLFIFISEINFMYKSAFFFITIAEMGLVTLPRILNRLVIYFKTTMDWNKALGRRTLIVGAGSAGEMVVKEVYRNKDLNNIPVAFLDDDPNKIGNKLSGIKIVGPIQDIQIFLDLYKIEEVIIAINDFPLRKLKALIELVSQKNVRLKRLTSITDVSQGERTQIIDVKIEDLLNREEIILDDAGIEGFIKDEIVLVTGGGGSIGSELCRQIAEFKPKQLIIFDIYENNAYDIQMELERKFKKSGEYLNLKVLIGSVYNPIRLENVFKEYRPTVVFHAAAYKHVPLMEDSAVEAVRTNVIGTHHAARLANQYEVKKFVLVSSDKAVRSTNVMGATKRFAELIIEEQNNHSKVTKFSAVRFGNVLGSNGSVIPLFKKQIQDGGPITVTDPEITRYFMTIPEAVGLILQCAVYAQGGEVFILDMGEPVKIKDLAEKMISLAGLKPNIDIMVEYVGLRPGEKLYEELLIDHEYDHHLRTANDKIYIEKQKHVEASELELDQIMKTFEEKTNYDVKLMVKKVVKTYKTNGK
ncbi:MAG: polysaccharide biosynthesis protein [Tenericutes bacterium]|nr:polysaccharide biosynthesis protein [Mycoplasmatota bacterium]